MGAPLMTMALRALMQSLWVLLPPKVSGLAWALKLERRERGGKKRLMQQGMLLVTNRSPQKSRRERGKKRGKKRRRRARGEGGIKQQVQRKHPDCHPLIRTMKGANSVMLRGAVYPLGTPKPHSNKREEHLTCQ